MSSARVSTENNDAEESSLSSSSHSSQSSLSSDSSEGSTSLSTSSSEKKNQPKDKQPKQEKPEKPKQEEKKEPEQPQKQEEKPKNEEPKQIENQETPQEPEQKKDDQSQNTVVRRNTSASTSRRSSRVQRRTTEIMAASPELTDEEEAKLDAEYHPTAPQIRAMIYRRWIYVKRSIGSVIANIIVTLIVSCLAIIVKVLMDSVIEDEFTNYNFNAYDNHNPYIVIISSSYDPEAGQLTDYFHKRYAKVIRRLFKDDTGMDPVFINFTNKEDADDWLYHCKDADNTEYQFISMGFMLPDTFSISGGNTLTFLWNDTKQQNMQQLSFSNDSYINLVNAYRVELAMLTYVPDDEDINDPEYYLNQFGLTIPQQYQLYLPYLGQMVKGVLATPGLDYSDISTIEIIFTLLAGQGKDIVFAVISPLLITAGITSVIATMIPNPIIEIQGPIRSYMESCSLQILPYWLITFLFDFIIWIIDITLVWVLFVACDIHVFSDNLGESYYILFICGPSFILYIYVLSFCFSDPENASRNAFILNIILLIIPIIVTLVTLDMEDPLNSIQSTDYLFWVYTLFPPLLLEGYMQTVFIYYSYNTEGLKYYFKSESSSQPYSIFAFLDIIIYAFILFLIEYLRKAVQRKRAQSNFGDYHEFFQKAKAEHEVTPEAEAMAKEVEENHDYAVRIENVSRLFFNTQGQPIPAVNCVSLGVKQGSLFGFLGANGAGKTTLINMITSMLPVSDGKIEINGKDISVENDPSLLSVCPQFNTHLCMDMTISEHLHFYSLLHRMAPDHERRNSERLIQLLDLSSFKDIPIRELSEGDVRKLSIALSFLGKAKIILLDEPTATLDPVSRRQVHEMVLYYKGQKTFMLCTHLLSEAETLCDMISIMIKGNVYTCGSPQYLSSKFGTDYKIDMMLNDESEETAAKVDKFFKETLPQAKINITRPAARIYNVPAQSIGLGALFKIMEKGKEGDNGFSYYTCSSSSLEKVFMEIVKMSEGEE